MELSPTEEQNTNLSEIHKQINEPQMFDNPILLRTRSTGNFGKIVVEKALTRITTWTEYAVPFPFANTVAASCCSAFVV